MKKSYKPVTSGFSKYFKSVIKRGNFFGIASGDDEYVYFLSSCIAGKIHKTFYADILQPLTLREAPAPGQRIVAGGKYPNFAATDIVSVVQENIKSANVPAQDTGFKIKLSRDAKEGYGNIIRVLTDKPVGAVVNECFIDMLDSSADWTLRGHDACSAVVASIVDQLEIVFMPMRKESAREAVNAIASMPAFNL